MEYKDIISNVRVYGIEESIIASGYPMLAKPYSESEFNAACEEVANNNDSSHIKRSVKLANTNIGEGHDNFLNGIFDLQAIVYDFSFTGVFLFLTVQSLEKRRWN